MFLFCAISPAVVGQPKGFPPSLYPNNLNGVSRADIVPFDSSNLQGQDLNSLLYETLAKKEIDPRFLFASLSLTTTIDGQPILHYLAKRGHTEAIRVFLSGNIIDINQRDFFGNTALHYSAWKNSDVALINFILSKGVDPDKWLNKKGETPLHLAAKNKGSSIAVFQALLEAGADPRKRTYNGETFLHYMAKYNQNPRAFKDLLLYDPELMEKDYKGNTPLHYWMSESNGNPAVLKALLKFSSRLYAKVTLDINTKNDKEETALHLKAKNTKHPMTADDVKLLARAGADFTATDSKGNTPLHNILQNPRPSLSVISALLAEGADSTAVNKRGQTPLHIAAIHTEDIEIIKNFEKIGVDFYARDKNGNISLHLAGRYNKNLEVLSILLSLSGGDLSVRNNYRETPSHLAVKFNKNSAVTAFLLKHKADFSLVDHRGRTPLHVISKTHEHFLRDFLMENSDLPIINARDFDEETPIFKAIKRQFRPKVLSSFVTAGAHLDIENKKGETPRDLLYTFLKETNSVDSELLKSKLCLRSFQQL